MEMATFDKDYQAQRAANRQQKARHAGDGILLGTRDFGKGLFQGITGVVTQPIKGAKEEGFVGALKGAGRGLVGVVVKPTVGVVDLVSRTTEGIANTASYIENRKRTRKRPPRYFDIDHTILPYNIDKAEGQELMRTLESGIFRKHIYQFHRYLSNSRVLIISDKAVIALKKAVVASTQSSEWIIDWTFPISRLQEPAKVDDKKMKAVAFDEDWKNVSHSVKCDSEVVLKEVYEFLQALPKPNIEFERIGAPLSAKDLHVGSNSRQGQLNKLVTEGMGKGSWKLVYCTVGNGEFLVSHKADSGKGEKLPLSRCFCVPVDVTGQEFCFALVVKPGHAWYFQASSNWLCQIWIDKCIANGAHKC
jgi:hypothetical protein